MTLRVTVGGACCRPHVHMCTHVRAPSPAQAVRKVSERTRTLSTAFSLAQPASHEEASGGGKQSFHFLVGEETRLKLEEQDWPIPPPPAPLLA